MIDRLFTAILAFTLLAGGSAAVGSALLERSTAPAAEAGVAVQAGAQRLPTVEISVRRSAA